MEQHKSMPINHRKTVHFTPSVVNFTPPFHGPITVSLKLDNTDNVAVAFKMKTKYPKRYFIRPSCGVVNPNSSITLQIQFNNNHDPLPSTLHATDKFLVQTIHLSPTASVSTMTSSDVKILFQKTELSNIMSQKLRATFKPYSQMIRRTEPPSIPDPTSMNLLPERSSSEENLKHQLDELTKENLNLSLKLQTIEKQLKNHNNINNNNNNNHTTNIKNGRHDPYRRSKSLELRDLRWIVVLVLILSILGYFTIPHLSETFCLKS